MSKVLPLAFPNLTPDPNPTLIILTLTHGRCLTYPYPYPMVAGRVADHGVGAMVPRRRTVGR